MTLDIITSPDLDGVTHGFFGRKGGASSGVFAGLNCGYGSSDQHEVVNINRARVADAMALDPTQMVGVHQVHSADVVAVEAPLDPQPKADALVTATPNVGLSILTADCQPVLFADRKAGVIGAAHAGWKGALNGVLENTVAYMETLGARAKDITAVIGPCISQRAYEVGPEFMDQFLAKDPKFDRFFVAGEGDRVHFDLPGFGLHKLQESGVSTARWTHNCTYTDPERFFSYRRSVHQKEADYGRLIATIRL
ncbi:peptidoglycan editing factor PgeF [Loktanella sp. D2R18]|uniref:peptidoglycan editing factor PgeF n=1 Tax=Rhodobacterales TaxID=204455 RepID=UPI000DE8A3C7|nr:MULTISPECIES: peptidoglycan editing factor PgeF [Rhodobacterales]MDO6589160.1 peptidoglycan editing factor PgeF [Yoonia sp. 1_MG-2023]RBW45411.1 peptidoglycan editing factor PgeF [Loktanella sp. D2R18]